MCEVPGTFDYPWQQETRNYNFMIINIQHASNNVKPIAKKRFNLRLPHVTQQLAFLKITLK